MMPLPGPGEVLLRSERLLLRNWLPEDVERYLNVLSAYPPEEQSGEDAWAVAQTQDYIRSFTENPFPASGYFHLSLVLIETGHLIGSAALIPFNKEENIPEIEWTIGPEYWNQGYATEIGREMIHYAFSRTGFKKIVGYTRPENAASMRVMEKLGMHDDGTMRYKNGTYRFYSIER